ncbi:MAG: OB-fold domain-containing protein, partial [Alistipes ihumii]
MYEYITGRVETLSPTAAVLEAGGIGYWLNISLQTFSQIGDRAEVRLYTHFVVRE